MMDYCKASHVLLVALRSYVYLRLRTREISMQGNVLEIIFFLSTM